MASFQLDLWVQILVTNTHVIKYQKKSWLIKLLDLMV